MCRSRFFVENRDFCDFCRDFRRIFAIFRRNFTIFREIFVIFRRNFAIFHEHFVIFVKFRVAATENALGAGWVAKTGSNFIC